MTKSSEDDAHRALNKVTKWRTFLTGWQLGTRPKGDPESDAVNDHREATILLRVQQTAVARLLIDKGVFTEDEFYDAMAVEAEELSKAYERSFPGVKATDSGLTIDARAAETMKGWLP